MRVRLNDQPLTISKTVVADMDDDGKLRITAIDGGIRLADGVRVPRGFSTTLTDDGWRSPRPMSATQMTYYVPLETLSLELVNEAIALPAGAYIRPGD
jgi:hypothetical protein